MKIEEQSAPARIEEDVPKNNIPSFAVSRENEQQTNDRDWLNTIKGHNLLGWCVFLFVFIYGIEFTFHQGEVSEIGKTVIEILKLLTFSLTGYLFGTSSRGND